MIIYKVTNKVNNKVYIGQTIQELDSRLYNHFYRAEKGNDNNKFYNAIRKYGKENFKAEVIDFASSQDELDEKEIIYISLYNSTENGYNTLLGGQDNSFSSDIMSELKGSKPFLVFDKYGNLIGEYINKKAYSRISGIAEAHIIGMIKNKEYSAKDLIIIDKEGYSEDLLKQRLSIAKLSFPFKAINKKTGQDMGIFENISECKKLLGIKGGHISEVLNGKRKSCEGYIFEIIEQNAYRANLDN